MSDVTITVAVEMNQVINKLLICSGINSKTHSLTSLDLSTNPYSIYSRLPAESVLLSELF